MTLADWIIADLDRSGLDATDAERAGFQSLSREQTAEFTAPHDYSIEAYELPYRDFNGDETGFSRIRFRKPVLMKRKDKPPKKAKYYQRAKTQPHLWIPQRIINYQKFTSDPQNPARLTEGEKKAEKAARVLGPTFALGGIWNYKSKRLGIPLLDELKLLASGGREFFIMFDGEQDMNPDIRRAENGCAEALTDAGGRVWISILPPGTKLDDLLTQEGPDYVDKLRKRPFDAKRHIALVRSRAGIGVREKREAISHIAVSDMGGRGSFFRTPDGPLYFDSKGSKPTDVSNSRNVDLRCFINDQYGINGAETEYSFLYENIVTEAQIRGTEADPRYFAHRSPTTGYIYVAASETEMFRVDRQGHERVANGTDGVILRAPAGMEAVALPDGKPRRTAFAELMAIPNIVDGEVAKADEMRLLFECWLWGALCGKDVAPTWPIALFHGPKGAAKTMEGKAVVATLYGAGGKVLSPDKKRLDGLDAALTSKHLVVLDNVDGRIDGLENRLAVVATGGSLPIRKLYSSNELLEIPVRAFLIVTSRQPESFTRDDVVDRLLYIKVATRTDYIAEDKIMADVLARRGDWWAYVLSVLPKIVRALRKRRDMTVDFRMADFATFALTVGPVLGYSEKQIQLALKHGEREKVAFVADQSQLPNALAELVTIMNKAVANKQYDVAWAEGFFDVNHSSTALLGYLKQVPGFRPVTAQALGQQIEQDWNSIKARVPSMDREHVSHEKAWRYIFNRKGGKK